MQSYEQKKGSAKEIPGMASRGQGGGWTKRQNAEGGPDKKYNKQLQKRGGKDTFEKREKENDLTQRKREKHLRQKKRRKRPFLQKRDGKDSSDKK